MVLRKSYGGGISAIASKEMGTDQMFVLPTAEIAILGAAPAVDILYRKEIEQEDDTEAFRQSKMREYQDTFCTPYHSASRMLVDAVIEPSAARARIIDALLMLETKTPGNRPAKKNGNIPL